MTRQTWLGDSLGWWRYALHHACCPSANPDDPYVRSSAQASDGVPSSEEYSCVLRYISKHDMEPVQAAKLLFLSKSLRKWKISDPQSARERRIAAIDGFIRRNRQVHLHDPIPFPYGEIMRHVLDRWLPPLSEDEASTIKGRFGPGACAERYTRVQRFGRLSVWCSDAHWPEVPLTVSDAGHVTARLCAVPKTFDKDRLITVEPAYGTFVQQYVRSYILESIHKGPLKWSVMDLGYVDSPQRQRRSALNASKNKNLATVDLSDASDGIGWFHIQQVFPAHIVDLLYATRSTCFVATDESDGKTQRTLRMSEKMDIFAGMGNATTFPIETLFFGAYVKAYAIAHNLPRYVGVFGDDIVCHTRLIEHMILNNQNFGFFKINPQKTFYGSDHLRESCGIFAYKGIDITVPKIDGYPNTWDGRLGLCDLHRRLLESPWGFCRRLAYLIARDHDLPNYPFRIEGHPSISNEQLAAMVGWSSLPPSRYNKYLQEREYKVLIRSQLSASYSLDYRRARQRNSPPPETFLPAVLAGMTGGSDVVVRDARRIRFGASTIKVTERGRLVKHLCWCIPT